MSEPLTFKSSHMLTTFANQLLR